MTLRSLLTEPLVQFLFIGSAVAGVYALSPRDEAPSSARAPGTIELSEGDIEQLREQFRRTWRRPPADEELRGMIDAFIREEILYRAGRGLELDEDDAVVRRRIAQKMEFLLEPGPGEIEIAEEDLQAHLEANPDRFRKPGRIAFRQVFVDPERHREGVDEAVAALRRQLDAGTAPQSLGDRTLLPGELSESPLANVERVFGATFAEALKTMATRRWAGPVASPFGLHLVWIETRIPPRDPQLDEVRDAVLSDLEAVRRKEIAQRRFLELKARYHFSIADPAPRDETAAASRGAVLQ